MNAEHFWAFIAFLTLAGWAATLVLLNRASLPMANALRVLQEVDAKIDDRISRVVERIRARQERRPSNPTPPTVQGTAGGADALSAIFGGVPFEPIGDQPDPERLEVVG